MKTLQGEPLLVREGTEGDLAPPPPKKIEREIVNQLLLAPENSKFQLGLYTVIQNWIFGLLMFGGEILFRNRIFAYH